MHMITDKKSLFEQLELTGRDMSVWTAVRLVISAIFIAMAEIKGEK